MSAAVEGFFRYGERWRHYRRTAELLKTEGWQFLQLTGHYRRHIAHGSAYPLFASRIDAGAKQTLAELYQGGPTVSRWVRSPVAPAVAAG